MRNKVPVAFLAFCLVLSWQGTEMADDGKEKSSGEEADRFNYIRSVSFVNKGKLVVTGGWDEQLHICRFVGDKNLIRTEKTGAPVLATAAIPKTASVVIGDNAGRVTIWNCEGKQQARQLGKLPRWIRCVAVSADGTTVAAGTSGGVICTWDASSGKERARRQSPQKSVIYALAFAPDGKSIAAGDDFGTITILDSKNLLTIKRWPAHSKSVYSLRYSPNGQLLVSGAVDDEVKIWSGQGRGLVKSLKNKGPVFSVDISPDSRFLATASGDLHVRVWDWRKQKLMFSFRDVGMVHSAAFSPDGETLASGSANNCLYLWDLSSSCSHRAVPFPSP